MQFLSHVAGSERVVTCDHDHPVGCILDLPDYGLRVSLEWAGDHDEANELEVALQGLPFDLPGLLVGGCPSSLYPSARTRAPSREISVWMWW